jgi:hypothetical protein
VAPQNGASRHLGCTAIWLSPVFENNPGAYHGYDINNYLAIDPHFGTRQDLIDLVEGAHSFRRNGEPFPIRVILDVVINHSGDNPDPAQLTFLYGDAGVLPVQAAPSGARFIQLDLGAHQLAILS